MIRVLRTIPAWAITTGYLAVSGLGVIAIGPPSDSTAGLLATIAALAAFVLVVALRGRQVGAIVGTVIATTGCVAFLADVANIEQPWKAAMALLIPVAAYVNCDMRSNPEAHSVG